MSSAPLVSVVIPIHNASRYLEPTLNCVARQTLLDHELIVVDDGSSDDSIDIVRRVAPHAQVLQQPQAGVSAARNRGLAQAHGRYVCFLDQDDLWWPEHLERQAAYLEAHPDVAAVACPYLPWRESRHAQDLSQDIAPPDPGMAEVPGFERWTYHRFLQDCWALTSATMLRTDVVRECGGFDEALEFAEDWALWLDVARKRPFVQLAWPPVRYRQHDHQGSRRVRSRDFRTELLLRAAGRHGLASPDGQAVGAMQFRRLVSRYRLQFGYHQLTHGQRRVALPALLQSWLAWPLNWRALAWLLGGTIGLQPAAPNGGRSAELRPEVHAAVPGHGLRVLLFSTLFPNAAMPQHGLFVEARLHELLKQGSMTAWVLAPVPWFPFRHARWGRYARHARTPRDELRRGLAIHHPRYVVLPKVGMLLAPFLLALASWGALRGLQRRGWSFDVIDAHYFYPDGVAAALLAAWFRRPFVVTARGSDINLIARHLVPRLLMRAAARRAKAVVGVSQALVDQMQARGIVAPRMLTLPNGVDSERFSPREPGAARAVLGLQGSPLLLMVGNLVENKGQRIAIEALDLLRGRWPSLRLVLVGDGADRQALVSFACERGLSDAVHFVGTVANADLPDWYSAADLLLLPSSREGWPNVVLESLACGTPVVATRVGGLPEILRSADLGRLVDRRDAPGFATAVTEVLATGIDREKVRKLALGFTWQQTTLALKTLFRQVVDDSRSKN